jgi:hypothetical protein
MFLSLLPVNHFSLSAHLNVCTSACLPTVKNPQFKKCFSDFLPAKEKTKNRLFFFWR